VITEPAGLDDFAVEDLLIEGSDLTVGGDRARLDLVDLGVALEVRDFDVGVFLAFFAENLDAHGMSLGGLLVVGVDGVVEDGGRDAGLFGVVGHGEFGGRERG
jgi:hypothetical protein